MPTVSLREERMGAGRGGYKPSRSARTLGRVEALDAVALGDERRDDLGGVPARRASRW